MFGTRPASEAAAADSRGRGPSRRPRGRRRRPAVEALESRRLLALTINEVPLPEPFSRPMGIAAGSDGNLWFTEYVSDKIGRITPTGAVTEFPLPTPSTYTGAIAAGPDGALWFTESGGIGRITTAGAVTKFTIPPPVSDPVFGPYIGYARDGIAAGPDGNLWFTSFVVDSSGYFAHFPAQYRDASVNSIDLSGNISKFPLNPGSGRLLNGIAAGPDGNLWFTGNEVDSWLNKLGGFIGRVTPAGAIAEFPLPNPESIPSGIAAGPDGNLWFTETIGSLGYIGRITTAGAITEFPIPATGPYPSPGGIAAGPDGALWFTESGGIGRITTAGAVTETPIPTLNSDPTGIAAGPDGNIWFTEYLGNKIGQVVLNGPGITRADLAITSAASPAPATAGLPLTYTLAVTNRGPDTAYGVTVNDALPSGAAFASAAATQGAAPKHSGGLVTAHLGNLAAGATATVTIVVTPAAAGALQNIAGVTTTSYDADPANNAASLTTTVNPFEPPARVVGLWRYGFHAQPTLLVVGFSGPLDPASAQNVGNYELMGPLRGRWSVGPTIPIASAALVAGGAEVVLAPARRLGLHYRYRLVIDGSSPTGVRDASGRLIDGAGAGQPGGDFVATFGREALAGPAPAARRWAAAVRPLAAHASWSTVARARHAGR